jgi:alpha-galactosidase
LGNPEVVEHLKTNLSRIITEFQLDWLKWDNSGLPGQPTVCNRNDHGHQKGDGSYAALVGAYAIWEHLHKNHPDVVLEQCGYGSRHDYGLARFCRANWLSDASYPSRHVRENTLTASHLYPSFYNGAWIVLDPEVQKQKDPGRLDMMYRSRMMGLFGFGTLTGKLLTERVSLYPKEVLDAARRNIPVYKRIRHLLAGDCYHLTPPSGSAEGWQAAEFCKRDGCEAVVFAFRGTSTQSRYLLQLKGLKPETRYVVRSENQATEAVRTGAELARDGFIVELSKVDLSELLLLRVL